MLPKKSNKFISKGNEQTTLSRRFARGNNGLGLMLLGVTGDQVLPLTYTMKSKNFIKFVEPFRLILKEDQAQNTCIFSTELPYD
jgi:methylmalonyl-CoA mutase